MTDRVRTEVAARVSDGKEKRGHVGVGHAWFMPLCCGRPLFLSIAGNDSEIAVCLPAIRCSRDSCVMKLPWVFS